MNTRIMSNVFNFVMLVIIWQSVISASAQFVLETEDFRLEFDNVGDSVSSIISCHYLPTNQEVPLWRYWSNIANTEAGANWDFPDSATFVEQSQTVKRITYHYSPTKNSTMTVTQHLHFLEFEMNDVVGNCGRIRMFGIFFPGTKEFDELHLVNIVALDNDLVAGIVQGNVQTPIYSYYDRTANVRGVYVKSPANLPTSEPYERRQKFAFFISKETELRQRITEIMSHFDLSFEFDIKNCPENDIDYLFLLETNGASSQDIINLCRETGLGSVLLAASVWSDWKNPSQPFKLKPEAKQLVADLKNAGLIVGTHTYLHAVPDGGYYAINYPHQLTQFSEYGFRFFTWRNNLPELVIGDYVERIKELGTNWNYLDGTEVAIWDSLRRIDGENLWYVWGRITKGLMNELRKNSIIPVIHQESCANYLFMSRWGQIDYWDGWPYSNSTPIRSIDNSKRNAANLRKIMLTPDLGWFGRKIHVLVSNDPFRYYDRDATWQEWQYLCDASWRYNIPLGIRTTYGDFISDSLRSQIVPLIRETIRKRRELWTDVINKERKIPISFLLEQNYPNPFNPSTTISFSIPTNSFVSLKIYDAMGKEVSALIAEELTEGTYSYKWNAEGLPDGVYFYCLRAGSFNETKKAIIIR